MSPRVGSPPASARRAPIYAYSEKPVIDPEGDIAGFCDSTDAWLPLVCTMNVTVATEAARHLFGWSHAQLDEAIRGVPPGADGLLFLPTCRASERPISRAAPVSFTVSPPAP